MKQRILSLWLALCMVLALLPATVQAEDTYDTWLKTDENGVYCYADFSPFTDPKASESVISTAEQLTGLAALVNVPLNAESELLTDRYGISVAVDRYKEWNVKLGADISLEAHEWVPIGFWGNEETGIKSFNGNFDGSGHTIDGMHIGTEETPAQWNCVGLFGFCEGNISNVKIGRNSIIYSAGEQSYIGSVCGLFESGSISYCENAARIVMNVPEESQPRFAHVGGLCGMANGGEIRNCRNSGDIEKGKFLIMFAGGICGVVTEGMSASGNGAVINCYNTGNITISSDIACVGGVCGEVDNSALIANSYNVGALTADGVSASIVSGICARMDGNGNPVIANCYNNGKLLACEAENIHVGGICGYFGTGSISGCYYGKGLAVQGISGEDTSAADTTTALPETQLLAAAGTAPADDWAEIEINGEAKGRLALVEALNAGAEAFEKEHTDLELLRWTVNGSTPEFGTRAPVYTVALKAQQIEGTDAVRLLAAVEGGTAPYTFHYLVEDDMGRWAMLRNNASARYIVHPSASKKQTFYVVVTDAEGNEARACYEVNA